MGCSLKPPLAVEDVKRVERMKLALLAGSLLTVLASAKGQTSPAKYNNMDRFSGGNFYIGLNYNPAFSRISNFKIGESSGSTAAVYPYAKDGTRIERRSDKFDWGIPDPSIRFRDSHLIALGASMGYSVGSARVELEIAHESFKTRGIKYSGSKEEEADTLYLLAKGLPHYLVRDQDEKFGKALSETTADDLVAFAQAVGYSAPGISGKVCSCKLEEPTSSSNKHHCRGDALKEKHGPVSLTEFGEAVRKKPESWPHGEARGDNAGGPNWAAAKYGLVRLTQDEKKVAAGLLTKTVSGGEVAEIRAVSTTSVMLNSCYDLRSEGFDIVPFACLGVGANFVSVVDGQVTPKLAYKVKAGLSYTLAPDFSIFAAGFYHKVLGNGEYDDLPVQHLVDDITTNKSKEFARASFKMAYTGAEIGVRLVF